MSARLFFIRSIKSLLLALALFGLLGGLLPDVYHAQSMAAKERMKQARKEEKERKKTRSTWDDRKLSQTVATLQSQAVSKKGACGSDCIATYRCTMDEVANEIAYPDYETYFIYPMRYEDMSSGEIAQYGELKAMFDAIQTSCRQQVDAGIHRNTTIAGLELQSAQVDSMDNNPGRWLEFHRNDSAISQYDKDRLETTFGKEKAVIKTLWIRQFNTGLNGNYAITQNRYNCAEKTVNILRYVVYTPFGTEVFGDYIPSQEIPMDLNNKKSEDYALYNRLCPAPSAPEKAKNN